MSCVCRIMRNLSLPVVWEDADMPEEWERDASAIPDSLSRGRYIFWSWTHGSVEKDVMPFEGNTSTWPGINNLSNFIVQSSSTIPPAWSYNITPPASMGMLFRDPSNNTLFQQGNRPFRTHMEEAGIQPTPQWPSMLYGTLPANWGQIQDDTSLVTLPALEVMYVTSQRFLSFIIARMSTCLNPYNVVC